MPSKSENQRKAAGAALSAKRGQMDPNKLQGASKSMYDSMSEKDLEDYAKKPVEESDHEEPDYDNLNGIEPSDGHDEESEGKDLMDKTNLKGELEEMKKFINYKRED